METKSVVQSKTIIANAAVILATVVGIVVQLFSSGNVPETWLPYAPAVIAIGNMVLRVFTKHPVALTKPKQ